MSNTKTFIAAYAKFKESSDYINANYDKLRQDENKWSNVNRNFKIKYQDPMDKAWDALDDSEKLKFDIEYGLNRLKDNEDFKEIKHVCDLFNGKIVKINGKE